MKKRLPHQCQCLTCQTNANPGEQAAHQQLNLVMSRLDEQQRRWVAALEANKLGHGGICTVHPPCDSPYSASRVIGAGGRQVVSQF